MADELIATEMESTTAAELPAAVAHAVALHARWLAREPGGVRADLRQHRLSGLDLRGIDFSEAVLRDADVSGSDLREAKFIRADLRFASFRGADLRGAWLDGARLDGVAFDGAFLTTATFDGATLLLASFEGVRMSWFDPTLMSERLFRAAGDDLELKMFASYIGRMKNFCWDDYGHLPVKYRLWFIREARTWKVPDDEAPTILDDRF